MRKIRVLQIISTMGAGGAQKIVLNYLNKFNNDTNVEMKLLVLGTKTNSTYECELENENYNVQYLNLKNKKIPYIHKFININFNESLILNAINDYDPDIIHIHLFGTLKNLANILGRCNAKAIFYTLHSNPERFTGLDLRIAKKVFLNPIIIPICLNKEQAKTAKKHYGITNYEIIHNGINYSEIKSQIIDKKLARKKFEFSDNDFVISAVGRLDPIKNYSFLLDVFEKVLKTKKNALLVFAGDGKEKENLINKTATLGISDRVVFLGNINNCIELYCASDTFVLPSISEASPLVLIEAQSCGIYCVISNGVPDESIVTNKVRKMKKDASINEWKDSLIDNMYLGKKVLNFEDYDIDVVNNNVKNLYLKHAGDIDDK